MSSWTIETGTGPIIATAIHAGHDLRPDISKLMALSEPDRLREEDPFTDMWLSVGDHTISVATSRFEVDLNRPRDSAVYMKPEDAWGLNLWKEPPTAEMLATSLEKYDAFYSELGDLCDSVAEEHGRFVLLDLHSYNHRREGPDAPVEDPTLNPEINVGTGSLDREMWGDVVEAFSNTLASQPFDGGHLDVRENIRFKGGHMSVWINQRYQERGCALAIEMKKFYMDEWTGEPIESIIAALGDELGTASNAIREVVGGETS